MYWSFFKGWLGLGGSNFRETIKIRKSTKEFTSREVELKFFEYEDHKKNQTDSYLRNDKNLMGSLKMI